MPCRQSDMTRPIVDVATALRTRFKVDIIIVVVVIIIIIIIIIIKMDLRDVGWGALTGSIWLRIGMGGELL